jgi:hypothetical protein
VINFKFLRGKTKGLGLTVWGEQTYSPNTVNVSIILSPQAERIREDLSNNLYNILSQYLFEFNNEETRNQIQAHCSGYIQNLGFSDNDIQIDVTVNDVAI